MRKNVFLRSTFRQPVRTLFLLLLIGVISFVFVIRAAEYLVVTREVRDISGYYRAIGRVNSVSDNADPEGASAYLEANPYVKTADRQRATSAVLRDYYDMDENGVTYSIAVQTGQIAPGVGMSDDFFYGTLYRTQELSEGAKEWRFQVNKVEMGYPEHVTEGKMVNVILPDEHEELLDALEVGKRYFLRVYLNPSEDMRTYSESGDHSTFLLRPLCNDGPWFYEAQEDLDLTAPEHAQLCKELRAAERNERSLFTYATADMSAMPEMQDSQKYFYLTEGRFLNAEDNAAQRCVCVVDAYFAGLRDLHVGDTLSMELRNIEPFLNGQYTMGLEENCAVEPMRYEIVGVMASTPEGMSWAMQNVLFIPLSTIPDSFVYVYEWEGTVSSIELSSPADIVPFLAEARDILAEMGFQVVFLESNWDSFYTNAHAMEQAALYNAVVFGVILLAVLCLASFIYFRFRRKDLSISRALGVSAGQCAIRSAIPLALVGGVGIAAGSAAAWWYAKENIVEWLSALAEFRQGEEAAPSLASTDMAALFGCLAAVLILLLAAFSFIISTRPVLQLFQTGGRKIHAPRSAPMASDAPPASLTANMAAVSSGRAADTAPPAKRGHRAQGAGVRFVRRQIVRSPVKNLLCLILAGAFIAGLTAIQVAMIRNQEKIDWLYSHTEVTLDVLKESPGMFVKGDGFLYAETLDELLSPGYFSDYYVEGAGILSKVTRMGKKLVTDSNGNKKLSDLVEFPETATTDVQFIAIQDPERFFDLYGDDYFITYSAASDSIFTQPHSATEFSPVVVSQSLYDSLGCSRLGNYVRMTGKTRTKSFIFQAKIVGVFPGENNEVLMPLSLAEAAYESGLAYRRANFTIDPQKNRELDQISAFVNETIHQKNAGAVEMSAVFWDQELQQAIRPMEEVIELMEVLFPVTAAVSLLVAAGISILLTLMCAKEAAILRVLGNGRQKVRMMLTGQTGTATLIGTVLGSFGAVLFVHARVALQAASLTAPVLGCAGLYLVAAILAAAVTAVLMTRKNPLELLQVKE